MSSVVPAKFFVNHGLVSSRTDITNLLRPLLKQTVTYRYYRGRDLVSHGTGWVERIVSDEPDISTYFTPISITLNVDSFEHLEFETRPDQLLVYTLVQGDERVVMEFAPDGPGDEDASPRAAPARVRHGRLRPDGAAGHRTTAATTDPGSDPALAADVRDAQRRRRAEPLAERLARPEHDDQDHEQVRQHLEEERRRAAGQERVREAEDRVDALDVEDEPEDRPEQVGPERRPDRAPLGEDDQPDRDPATPATVWSPNQPGGMASVMRRAGQAGQQAADADVGVAEPVHVDALGVGGGRVLADRPQVEARAGVGGSSTRRPARAGSRRTRGRSGR